MQIQCLVHESEAMRGGWTLRQLDSMSELPSREKKAAMLGENNQSKTGDSLTTDEEIKDPYVLEFLGLKDEYSESELEDAAGQTSGAF